MIILAAERHLIEGFTLFYLIAMVKYVRIKVVIPRQFPARELI
jgi:hypothetical protein